MSYSKKKLSKGLSRKKVSNINPREYTIMGSHPDHIAFNPSGDVMTMHPISHKLEKWILIILLAFAMAAFMGFKLFENSDLSFTLSDGTTNANAAHSVSSDSEFKSEFNKNRDEARALMEKHSIAKQATTPKYGKGTIKYYAKSKKMSSKKIAKRPSFKKKIAHKTSRKKTVAQK